MAPFAPGRPCWVILPWFRCCSRTLIRKRWLTKPFRPSRKRSTRSAWPQNNRETECCELAPSTRGLFTCQTAKSLIPPSQTPQFLPLLGLHRETDQALWPRGVWPHRPQRRFCTRNVPKARPGPRFGRRRPLILLSDHRRAGLSSRPTATSQRPRSELRPRPPL